MLDRSFRFVLGREKDATKSEVARLIQLSIEQDRRRQELRRQELEERQRQLEEQQRMYEMQLKQQLASGNWQQLQQSRVEDERDEVFESSSANANQVSPLQVSSRSFVPCSVSVQAHCNNRLDDFKYSCAMCIMTITINEVCIKITILKLNKLFETVSRLKPPRWW